MAKAIEMKAIILCHLKGILPIPFIISNPNVAVVRKDNKVIIPRYIIRGFPKIKKYVIFASIVFYSALPSWQK